MISPELIPGIKARVHYYDRKGILINQVSSALSRSKGMEAPRGLRFAQPHLVRSLVVDQKYLAGLLSELSILSEQSVALPPKQAKRYALACLGGKAILFSDKRDYFERSPARYFWSTTSDLTRCGCAKRNPLDAFIPSGLLTAEAAWSINMPFL